MNPYGATPQSIAALRRYKARRRAELDAAVLAALRSGPKLVREVEAAIGMSRRSVMIVLKRLAVAGRVRGARLGRPGLDGAPWAWMLPGDRHPHEIPPEREARLARRRERERPAWQAYWHRKQERIRGGDVPPTLAEIARATAALRAEKLARKAAEPPPNSPPPGIRVVRAPMTPDSVLVRQFIHGGS